MFILISNYVYSMLQPPLFSSFYFMFYTYPSFVSFMSRWDMFLGGQDYLSILCQANLLPILNFSCKSWWLLLLFLLLFLSTFANLVEGLFYRNLLCNISCLGICLVLLYLHFLTDRNWHDNAPMDVRLWQPGGWIAPPKELIVNYNLTCGCRSRRGSPGADDLCWDLYLQVERSFEKC